MSDTGMIFQSPEQTISGGVDLEQQEIQLGLVIYQVQRVYAGSRPIQELVIDKMEQQNLADPTFDECSSKAV